MGLLKTLHNDMLSAGKLPVKAIESPPVIAVERWKKNTNGFLEKKFLFVRMIDRNRFMNEILECELNCQHPATYVIKDDYVIITVSTKGVDVITELDKEFAKSADELYKEVLRYSADEQARRKLNAYDER